MQPLDKFREEWIHELKNKSNILSKKDNFNDSDFSKYVNESRNCESRAFELAHCLLRGEYISEDDFRKTSKHHIYQSGDKGKSNNAEHVIKKRKTLIDTLIKDLDEINEIPFFDITLPREIALKIFRHLDIVDLCHCAQVSKSWRSLAEDELLWYEIYHKLGYQKELTTLEKQKWKKETENAIQKEKKLRNNWKNRTGRLYDMEDVRSGILCAAHSCGEYVLAGYTTGKVFLWNFQNDAKDEKKMIINPITELSCDVNRNENKCLSAININPQVIALGYEDGHAYILSNTPQTKILETYSFPSSVTNVVTDVCNNTVGISSSNTVVMVDSHSGKCNYYKTVSYPTKVNHLNFASSSSSSSNIAAVIACDDALYLQNFPSTEEEALIVYHLIGTTITCLDVSNDLIATGITSQTGYNMFQVSLFTVNGGRLYGTLNSHAGAILCLNLRKSPENLIVTGCRDKRVRVFDLRTCQPEISISAHSYGVTCAQMDEYHVVTGGEEGLICIWDIRTHAKLWEMYNRHPVKYLCCDTTTLVTANIPSNRNPQPDDGEIIVHKQQRGSLRRYDFSADQVTKDIPSICLSSYDEPAGYNYNIRLAMPYDNINY